jgi:hypothetical protein
MVKVYRVKADGTRICLSRAAPKSEPTFAERVANATASMVKLGLDDAALLRMKRRIEWKRKLYGPQGA